MKKIFTLLFLACSFASFSQSTTLVISQVYGAGGNSGATYNADFVELHNVSGVAQSISGFSIQYQAAATTTAWTGVSALPAASIPAGGYYLIQMSTTGTTGAAITPDNVASPSIAMAATAGKVALVSNITALNGCPTTNVIDLVGYGTTASCFEGTGPAPAPSATNSDLRGTNGCLETNQNATDFTAAPVLPRNSSTTPVICGVPTPTLTATPNTTAFGNVCINTTAGPNSFTISGTTLTTANVTVAALPGFTYSTTSGGTYTTTLSLTQTGGSFSQQIFVKFTPTAVQSYNGNIAVGGGGAPNINVAATGAGVNSMPTVASGAASAITSSSATVAGTLSAPGCTTVTAYGIEYSTTAGFANGTGTAVPSTNLAGTAFSSALSGLAASTTYYYHAYATNSAGTSYGAEMSFTTTTLATPTLTATALTGFGNFCINTTTAAASFTLSGTNLTTANVTVGPLAGYRFSTTIGGTYTASLSLTQTGGTYSQQIFVKFTPTAVQSYSGNIPAGGGGATTINVPVTGAGVNSVPTLTVGAATSITISSATVPGTITGIGCSAVTAYGIEYSTTAGFVNGSGTPVPSSNLAGGNFSSALSGLAQNTTYHYHAYATNSGGTGYSTELSFTTLATTPTLNTTALTAFGNICLNATAGPNSFTINGSALNTTNIIVGPLTGYTFSSTSGGTYTASLSLTQPGGTYTQQIFVKFTPTAVQSYNGSIPVSGGGATGTSVTASGAGINTIATVTTGTASAITGISATLAGSIPSIGCSAITAYGVEYSTVNGFANGTGTAVPSSNLAGNNFSSNVSGLTPSTVYYYHAYATNSGGTAYGAQQTFTTASPTLTAGTLAGFGNVCVGTTSAANSFTITGTNLSTANVTVGPLAGYTFSTTATGIYTASLSLTQPGGAYSQQIFVQLTPTAVQSYNGNIPVGGGGAAAINKAVTGAGINTPATVTSGAASAITSTSATVAGTITSTGCSAVTVYGIEYSTTTGFANGTGTAVPSTNLSGTGFTSSLTGLTPSTTYYYHAYATNGGGTAYGTQQSFTTTAAVLTATPLVGFGNVCINTTAGPNSFTLSSSSVSAANINIAALNGYSFSLSATGPFTPTLSITHPAGAFSQVIYVNFKPTIMAGYNGNISISGGGLAAPFLVPVTGSGVNILAAVTTGDSSNITTHSVTISGTLGAGGCTSVTEYGVEYSSISTFLPGTGIRVPSVNLANGTYSVTINGLVQNTIYYYRAYATTASGTSYGAQRTVTTKSLSGDLVIYSSPITHGGQLRFSLNNIRPASYIVMLINSEGRQVYYSEKIVQLNFIDDFITVPFNLPKGMYVLELRNSNNADFRVYKSFLLL